MTLDESNTTIKGIAHLKQDEILELMRIGLILRKAIELDDQVQLQQLEQYKPMLILLLEHMIKTMDSANIDQGLLRAIEQFLGIRLSKDEDKELEEQEHEEELSHEEKQRRLRLAIYEVYKVFNPHRLAGETMLENFINNVKTRGLQTALQNDGHDYAKYFKHEDLKNLESYKQSFVNALEKEGHKGFGRGI